MPQWPHGGSDIGRLINGFTNASLGLTFMLLVSYGSKPLNCEAEAQEMRIDICST
jgi:hypothetical protein